MCERSCLKRGRGSQRFYRVTRGAVYTARISYLCINTHSYVLRIRTHGIDTAHTCTCIHTYTVASYVRVKPLYRGNALNRSSTLAIPLARASTLHFVHFRSSTLSPFSYSCPLASFNAILVPVAASLPRNVPACLVLLSFH